MRSPFRRRRPPATQPIRQDERAPEPPAHVYVIGSLVLWELLEDVCDLLYGPGMDGEQRAMTN